MSEEYRDQVLAGVIDTIRVTVDEDWIHEFPMGRDTRLNEDLEIESIELVRIAAALQTRFGSGLDFNAWLAGRSIHELISLSVGELADYVAVSARA